MVPVLLPFNTHHSHVDRGIASVSFHARFERTFNTLWIGEPQGAMMRWSEWLSRARASRTDGLSPAEMGSRFRKRNYLGTIWELYGNNMGTISEVYEKNCRILNETHSRSFNNHNEMNSAELTVHDTTCVLHTGRDEPVQ